MMIKQETANKMTELMIQDRNMNRAKASLELKIGNRRARKTQDDRQIGLGVAGQTANPKLQLTFPLGLF